MIPSTCNPERIESFLRESLSAEEQQLLEEHLSECSQCRTRLERSTAETRIWHEASDFLRDEPFDLSQVGDLSDPSVEIPLDEDEPSLELQPILNLLGPTDDPERLGRIGHYEIAGVIGTGGMGIVLKAFDASLNRYVAIKVLAPHLASSAAARRRFAREAQAAAAVVHENVLAIHGVDAANGLPYLVMPYIRGTSLETRIQKDGPLPVIDVLRIGMQAAAGLAAAHAQGLVHRDIKPSNILLTDGISRVAITDFGLARTVDDASLTRTGVIAGTPQYMSPEQARGEAIGRRSDLFSLGSVLYAMCTGHAPFRAETSYAVLRRITDVQPRNVQEINAEVPRWLAAIIAKLHQKDPAERFRSAGEVAQLLEKCLAHMQSPSAIRLPGEILELERAAIRAEWPQRVRRQWKWLAAATATAAAIGLFAWLGPKLPSQTSETDKSQQQQERSEQLPQQLASQDEESTESDNSVAWETNIDQTLNEMEREFAQLELDIEQPFGTQVPLLHDSPKRR